jgi:hypothetical protein
MVRVISGQAAGAMRAVRLTPLNKLTEAVSRPVPEKSGATVVAPTRRRSRGQ